MRHWVNLALLFSFSTLMVTGVLAFTLPFSQTNTRLHVVSGVVCVVLVTKHVLSRLTYFRSIASRQSKAMGLMRKASVLGFWAVVLVASVAAVPPTNWLMDQSYETRQRTQIVRTSSLVGFGQTSPHQRIVVRKPKQEDDATLSIHLGYSTSLDQLPVTAAWVESTTGTMIETLYLDEGIAYGEVVPRTQSSGVDSVLRRSDVLPIWRHAYTIVSGVDPDGDIDGLSGATQNHRFELDPYLQPGKGNRFVVCVEFNLPGDTSDDWQEREWGQPSLLYTALIDVDSESPHAILELTGHGGGSESDGNIRYDLENISTARNIADLFLAKIDLPQPSASSADR
ncbi:DUF4405 domain-containing protein [Rhodopirellula bahusiensis]|uniref:Flavinylation-associated cytochrome domain-containing protein n=1 Tax=Rhodopirellula bahusiensis TaxID=2014065 RepID=A0A2G1VYF2_9BACT|nr:DUF4405 domain-containing protein [Rhodopirellula bahusiensis]PHQ31765.1 hypothetical protein CEE69_29465 [Rhodopirellula bahusiensis]